MVKSIIFFVCFLLFPFALFAQENAQSIVIKLSSDVEARSSCFTKKKQTGVPAIDSISDAFGAISTRKLKTNGRTYVITYPAYADIPAIIKAYLATNLLEYAEADGIGTGGGAQGWVPNDSLYFRQWALNNDGSFAKSPAVPGADIQMEYAWDVETGNSDLIIAIMDSGTKLDHPDLEDRIWLNKNEIAGNQVDDDGNGYVDDIKGWDFVNNDNLPMDDLGHGTNIAGIIACKGDNTIGYAGVVQQCKIMTVKGLNSANWGYWTWFAEAIYYAVDNGAMVINLSVVGAPVSETMEDAVNYALDKNVVVVACMGNNNTSSPSIPAMYDGVIAVGSTSANDKRTVPFFWNASSGSDYGSHISVVAPGNYIYSLSHSSNTNYESYWGGTSQAAPHVTGVCALLKAQDPTRTPEVIKSIIESTAEDQVGDTLQDKAGWDQYYGWGRLNAYQALVKGEEMLRQNPASKEQIRMFPNPAENKISISGINNADNYSLKIVNVSGQIIWHGIAANSLQLPESMLPGAYFVVLENSTSSYQYKLVKY